MQLGSHSDDFCEMNNNITVPDNKVHEANMGPTWVLSVPDGPHVGPMNLAIRGGKSYEGTCRIPRQNGARGGHGSDLRELCFKTTPRMQIPEWITNICATNDVSYVTYTRTSNV